MSSSHEQPLIPSADGTKPATPAVAIPDGTDQLLAR